MHRRHNIGALLVGLIVTSVSLGQEWPQWRGPDRTGVSADKNLLDQWPAGGPPLLWTAEKAGQGFSSVSIHDGRMYTMGNRGNNEFIIAYDVNNGKQLWAKRIAKAYKNRYGDGPRCTPTVDGDRVYALGANGDLWCLDAKSGKKKWRNNILKRFGGKNIRWGISESPLIDGERLIVACGGKNGGVVALNKETGKLIWRCKEVPDDPGYASALVRDVGGVRQIIHFVAGGALGIRAADGKLLWRYDNVANRIANCTTPVYQDGYLFLTAGYDSGAALLKLTSNGDTTDAEEVYFTRNMINHHGGVILVDGYVYGFSSNTLMCLDFKTGKRMWRDRSVGKGSLTCADGKLICVSEGGTIGLAEATPEQYREISRFDWEPRQKSFWAHPVVAGGRLFLRNGDQIRCYDLRAGGSEQG